MARINIESKRRWLHHHIARSAAASFHDLNLTVREPVPTFPDGGLAEEVNEHVHVHMLPL